MSFSFYWHDYETSGIDPALDRPVQFAGLRTDADLNPIGEPSVWFCQLSNDVLPHPEACLVTGLTPQEINRRGMPEPQFIEQIVTQLGQPGTCGVGYNSLRFDDEVTRHTLYRNFFDPYEREWRNGCSRWDLIDVMRLAAALRPEGIEWPRRDDGNISFRLEQLTVANGIEHGNAHDALADVQATIALARCLKQAQPRLFEYALGLREKTRVSELIDLTRQKPLLHISGRIKGEWGHASLVMPLCWHPTNRNALITFDLRYDPEPLLSLDAEAIAERVFRSQADLGSTERIPLKLVHINRSPMLASASLLDEAACERLQLDLPQCRAHYRRLAGQPLQETLHAVYRQESQWPARDVEAALYDGFIGDADKALGARLRSQGIEALLHGREQFRDARLRELWFRYRARHAPHTLDEQELQRWQQWRQNRLEFGEGGVLSLTAFCERLDQLALEHAHHPDKLRLLEALARYAQALAGG